MPYAPGTEYRGDQWIFQGGRQTAQAMTEWLQTFLDKEKQVTAAGKSADYFVKANPDALDEMGVHPDEWSNLGAREKAQAVSGYMQGKAAQRAGAEAQAQTQLRQAEAAKAQTEADATAGLPTFAKYLNEEMNAPSWPPPGNADWNGFLQGKGPVQTPGTATGTAQPVTMSQAVLRALARVQSMNPQLAAAVASKVLPGLVQNASEDSGVNFTQDPVTGQRFATHGKTLQGSGMDPAFATQAMSGGAAPMKDEDGNVIGYNMPIGRGNFKFYETKSLTPVQKQNLIVQHQRAKSDLLGKLTLAAGNTNIVNAINEEMGTHDNAIKKLSETGKATPEPTPTAPIKVTSQAQYDGLPNGAVYIGKDGKSYRKP